MAVTATALENRPQTQVRCGACKGRLLDYVNEIRSGRILLEIKCDCGKMHLELVGELRG